MSSVNQFFAWIRILEGDAIFTEVLHHFYGRIADLIEELGRNYETMVVCFVGGNP